MDASWLRKKITAVTEMQQNQCVLKAVNLVLQWGLNGSRSWFHLIIALFIDKKNLGSDPVKVVFLLGDLEMKTNSAIVFRWVETKEEKKRPGEIIIKQSLGNLQELVQEYGLNI